MLIFVAVGAARAQEAVTRTLNLDEYTKALAHYGYTATSMGGMSGENPQKIIQLAAVDPTLARAPRVRLLTLNILQKVNSVAMAENRGKAEGQALQNNYQRSSRTTTGGSSDGYNNKRPPKPDPGMQLMQDQAKIGANLQKLREDTSAGIKAIVAQISALEETPEGQQFAMPSTSALLGKLDPFSAPVSATTAAGGVPSPQWHYVSFEVSYANPDGFYGYAMVPDINKEQNGDQPPGSRKTDEKGGYVYVVNRAETVFVRGYTKPVSMGDILRIKVSQGAKKMVNGVEVQDYVVVPE